MIGLALFVLGLFSLATYNLQLALATLEERVEIVAYLRDDVGSDKVAAMTSTFTKLPEVLAINFVTKDEALLKARRELTEFREILTDLEVNPLPASIEIQLQPGSRTPETVDRLARQAGAFPIVEEVQYGEEWVSKLFTLRRIGGVTTTVLGTAFALVAALIIGSAVRIAIFARKEEIKVMQLVGARDELIRRPFLIEGVVTGALGGFLAVALTYVTFRSILQYLFTISWIPFEWAVIGILAGMAFGFIASSLSVRKHLSEI
tara:strand:- start:87 stop:872 length:786 start_codon:yes stop_codon:yes gene_type:complete